MFTEVIPPPPHLSLKGFPINLPLSSLQRTLTPLVGHTGFSIKSGVKWFATKATLFYLGFHFPLSLLGKPEPLRKTNCTCPRRLPPALFPPHMTVSSRFITNSPSLSPANGTRPRISVRKSILLLRKRRPPLAPQTSFRRSGFHS